MKLLTVRTTSGEVYSVRGVAPKYNELIGRMLSGIFDGDVFTETPVEHAAHVLREADGKQTIIEFLNIETWEPVDAIPIRTAEEQKKSIEDAAKKAERPTGRFKR